MDDLDWIYSGRVARDQVYTGPESKEGRAGRIGVADGRRDNLPNSGHGLHPSMLQALRPDFQKVSVQIF